jgi:hypothetical protein
MPRDGAVVDGGSSWRCAHRDRPGYGRATALLGALALALLSPRPVWACSVPGCLDSTLPARGRTIPRTARGVFIHDRWASPADPNVAPQIVEPQTGLSLPVTVTRLGADGLAALTWRELPVETSSLAIVRDGCSSAVLETTPFTLGPAAPFPTTLGPIAVSPSTEKIVTELTFTNAQCGPVERRVAEITTRVTLSPEAEPWRWALLFRVEVDGRPIDAPPFIRFPFSSLAEWYGPDQTFKVQLPCPGGDGDYTIGIRADAVGYPTLRTETRVVKVACSGAPQPRPRGGDSGIADVGAAPDADGSEGRDAGLDDTGQTPSADLPVSCSTMGGSSGWVMMLNAALVGWAARRRGR